MKNTQNCNGSINEGDINDPKTNEDYNQKQPDQNNPNELAFSPYIEVPQTEGHDYGTMENESSEEGFCWLPTDPTNYIQAHQPNEQLIGWVMVSI